MAERGKKETEAKGKTGESPENPNEIVAQFNILQQQLQSVLLQKENLRLNAMEMSRALEELDKSKDKTAYKITGPIMISKPAEELKKELKDIEEALKVRIESLEKTEKHLTDRLKGLQEKLKEILK